MSKFKYDGGLQWQETAKGQSCGLTNEQWAKVEDANKHLEKLGVFEKLESYGSVLWADANCVKAEATPGETLTLQEAVKAYMDAACHSFQPAPAWDLDVLCICQLRNDPKGWITVEVRLRPRCDEDAADVQPDAVVDE